MPTKMPVRTWSCSGVIAASRGTFLPPVRLHPPSDFGHRPIGDGAAPLVTVTRMSEVAASKVLVERRGEVDVITINRPVMRNALDFEAYDLLEAAVRDTSARCIVITGTDPAF